MLPEGWEPLDYGRAERSIHQLRFELGPDDPFGPYFDAGAIRAIGASVTSEHVVFEIEDWETPFFVSELSWAKPDPRPSFLQWLSPEARPDPGLVPISNLADLAGWDG